MLRTCGRALSAKTMKAPVSSSSRKKNFEHCCQTFPTRAQIVFQFPGLQLGLMDCDRLWPTLANPFLANPLLLLSVVVACCVLLLCVVVVCWCVVGLGLLHPTPDPPPPDRPKFRSFFFLSRPIFVIFHSLWVFSLNFGCFFEGCDPQMCTFGLSGCRSPRTIRGSRRFKHHQNSMRRHPERDKKSERGAGEGKKKREILGPLPSGHLFRGCDFRAPLFLGLGHTLWPHHDTHKIQKWIGPNWTGRAKTKMVKNGLAKIGWPKRDWPK